MAYVDDYVYVDFYVYVDDYVSLGTLERNKSELIHRILLTLQLTRH